MPSAPAKMAMPRSQLSALTSRSRTAILSDMQMPGTSGTALAEAMRALCPQSVIIGMSASKPAGGMLKGFDAFLLKPFDGAQFTQALDAEDTPRRQRPCGDAARHSTLTRPWWHPLAAAMPPGQLAAVSMRSRSRIRASASPPCRSRWPAGDDGAFRREAHAIKGGALPCWAPRRGRAGGADGGDGYLG